MDLKQLGPGYPPPYCAVFNATMKSLSTLLVSYATQTRGTQRRERDFWEGGSENTKNEALLTCIPHKLLIRHHRT